MSDYATLMNERTMAQERLKLARARIAELEARLTLAENVCEAVLPEHQWSTGDIADETKCPICAAVSAWEKGK